MTKRTIIATAVSIFAAGTFVASAATAQTSSSPSFGQNSTDCKGVNACKGQSACKGATNSCKGQNACKGQGWSESGTSLECTAKGGKVM